MKSTDKRFVGTWKGTDEGRLNEFEVNHWIMSRSLDGKFFVEFTTIYLDGTFEKTTEKGIWYIENGLYYELLDSEKIPVCYIFRIISNDSIHYQDYLSSYYFTDYKVPLN
ncbi:MAG TPA: hypothetical protein VLY87_00010 [Flavobacterium sp.]|nr:hypothetical protein [Flavobacterium sp.]